MARRTMDKKEGKPDQSGYHLIVLAKNEKGYHNLIKLVSRAWTMGYYMRPRTDRNELEKYHEGLIVCSACIGGEIPKKIINDQLDEPKRLSAGIRIFLEMISIWSCSATRQPSPAPTTRLILCSRRPMPNCWNMPRSMA